MGPSGELGPRCARCHRTVTVESTSAKQSTTEYDAEDSRRRIYQSLRAASAVVSAGDAGRTLRYDLGGSPLAESFDRPHRRAKTEPRPQRPQFAEPASLSNGVTTQLASWLITAIGAVALGLGIGLGAWSLLLERPELWNPALAAAIGGQGLLIIGLVQILATLWNAARQAQSKLHAIHEELRRVRRTTEEHAGRNQASAATFFADLAQDAPAEMLVGNLRGQLDRLAARLR